MEAWSVIHEGGPDDQITITDGERAIAYVEPGEDAEKAAQLMARAPALAAALRNLLAATPTPLHNARQRGAFEAGYDLLRGL